MLPMPWLTCSSNIVSDQYTRGPLPTPSRQLTRAGSSGSNPLSRSTLGRNSYPVPFEPALRSSGRVSPRPWATTSSELVGFPPRYAPSAALPTTRCRTFSTAPPAPPTYAQLTSGSDPLRWHASSLPCPTSPTSRPCPAPRSHLRTPPLRPVQDRHKQQQPAAQNCLDLMK